MQSGRSGLHRLPLVHVALFVVAAVVLLIARTARAQGAEPHLPDPISTIKLHRLLNGVIGPRDPRWADIEAAHDAYLAELRPQSEGAIERILPALELGYVTDLRTIDDVRRIVSTIAAADDRLFAAIGAILGDDSGATLVRVRESRTRDRLRSTMGHSVGLRVGLGGVSEAVRGAVVDPQLLAALDPALRAYEEKATSLMRRAVDVGLEATEDGLRAVRDAKLPAPDPGDQEGGRRWWEEFQQGVAARGARRMELLAELGALDASTAAAILKQLPFHEGRAARLRLERALLGGASDGLQASVETIFQVALRSSEVDAEGKAAVLDAYRAWAKEDDAFSDRWIARTLNMTHDDGVALQADRVTRRESNNRWHAKLLNDTPWGRTILDEYVAITDGRYPQEVDPFNEEFLLERRPEQTYVHDARWRPRPLTAERIDRMADRLRFDDDERAIARSLHADLTERWNEGMAPLVGTVRAAEQAIARIEGNRVRTLPEGIDALVSARLAVLEGAAKIDNAFYDDLQAVLGARRLPEDRAEIELSRLSRAMERLGTGDWAMYLHPCVIVRPVDPVAIIDRLELSPHERDIARRALLDRGEAIVAAARARAEAQAGLEPVMNEAHSVQFAAQEAAQRGGATDEERKAAWAESHAAQRRGDREGADRAARRLAADRIVRAAFTDSIAAFDDAKHRVADERYERRAVPEFFADARAPWPLIERALAIRDLDAAARDAIIALRDEAQRSSTLRAVAFGDLRRTAPDPGVPSWRHVARQGREAAIRFDRDELSARTVSRLRRLLTQEQQGLVRGLDDYERRVERVRDVFIRASPPEEE